MHRKLFIGIIMVLVLLSPAAALAGGDIYVGGPYGTKITSLPYVISAPGAYYLGGNLSYSGDDHGITVNADNVTLDLMGFTLAYTGTDPPWSGIYGIHMDNRKNVEVRNGTLLGWDAGVWETAGGVGHRIINIRAVDVNAGVMLIWQWPPDPGVHGIKSKPRARFKWLYYELGVWHNQRLFGQRILLMALSPRPKP